MPRGFRRKRRRRRSPGSSRDRSESERHFGHREHSDTDDGGQGWPESANDNASRTSECPKNTGKGSGAARNAGWNPLNSLSSRSVRSAVLVPLLPPVPGFVLPVENGVGWDFLAGIGISENFRESRLVPDGFFPSKGDWGRFGGIFLLELMFQTSSWNHTWFLMSFSHLNGI